MALSIKFVAVQTSNRKGIVIEETTGAYNAIANPGGYGAPNPVVGDAVQAVVYVTGADGIVHTVDVSASLPSATNGSYTIVNTDIGFTADSVIPDGYYVIRYELTMSNADVYSYSMNVLIYGSVACCVRRSGAGKRSSCGPDKFTEMRLALESMVAADECNDVYKAKQILKHLQRMCNDCGCGCGGR